MEILFTYFRRGSDVRYEQLILNLEGAVRRLDLEIRT